MTSADELVGRVRSYHSGADVELIRRAYDFSRQVHRGQKRQSGDPYFVHPVGVACLIADLKLDVPSIVTGLLHDTVEDTLTTLSEIEQQFGDEIAGLVDGVTKISQINFSSREEKQAENFRKMVLAMAKDIRVILVKLADRLNNMRTLEHLPRELVGAADHLQVGAAVVAAHAADQLVGASHGRPSSPPKRARARAVNSSTSAAGVRSSVFSTTSYTPVSARS